MSGWAQGEVDVTVLGKDLYVLYTYRYDKNPFITTILY